MDLMTEPERTEFLLDGVFRFLVGLTEQFAGLGVDAVFFADDQAMQTGPLFSMDIWRELFKPRYRALCSLAHEMACKVYMHTCGDLSQHLTELADVGVDVIDNKQPALWMDCVAVDEVRGRVSFSTCLDIQSVIGTIDLSRIPGEVSGLIRRLSVPEGGFIGTCYHQPDLHIAPEKNARMIEAFRSFTWD
jgi:uroporphyrinogen decarboxylase